MNNLIRFMVIEDIPFEKLSSPSFRCLLSEIYNDVSKSPNTFKTMFINYSIKRRDVVKSIIQCLIKKKVKFYVSFDECVSVARKSYE